MGKLTVNLVFAIAVSVGQSLYTLLNNLSVITDGGIKIEFQKEEEKI